MASKACTVGVHVPSILAALMWLHVIPVAVAQAPADSADEKSSGAPGATTSEDVDPADPPGYRDAISEAVAEYAAGHFAEARTLFSRAHQLAPSARTLRGLGMVEFELRRYVDSEDLLRDALDSPRRPLTGSLRSETERLLARAQQFVGRFHVLVQPDEAQLLVDGGPATMTNGVLRLSVGTHVLEAHAPGHVTIKRSVSVAGGEDTAIELKLPTEPVYGRKSSDSPRKDRDAPSVLENPWLWAAVGAAAVGTAVGVGIGVANAGDTIIVPPYGGSSNLVLSGP